MITNTLPIKELELHEARYWSSLYLNAGSSLQMKLGLNVEQFDDAVFIAASKMDVLAFNRVIGSGLSNTLTREQLGHIIGFYREHEVSRFFLQLCPDVLSPDILELLIDTGFAYYNNWCKHIREIDKYLPLHDTDLSVVKVQPDHVDIFTRIMNESFDFGYELEDLVASTYGHPECHFYLVKDENRPVAAASMSVYGEHALLTLGGTLPEARNRGAQSLLIATRINDAIDLGCRVISTETAEDRPEKPSPSFRNMKRAGFSLAYLRPNFIYQF
jgi:hypothetical protein